MKQLLYILGIIIVVILVVVYLQQDGGLFKSQLLNQPEGQTVPGTINEITNYRDCLKFSEIKANACLSELALKEKDAKICDKITKSSEKKSCQRKVELYQ